MFAGTVTASSLMSREHNEPYRASAAAEDQTSTSPAAPATEASAASKGDPDKP
jgi:hypothetical protein